MNNSHRQYHHILLVFHVLLATHFGGHAHGQSLPTIVDQSPVKLRYPLAIPPNDLNSERHDGLPILYFDHDPSSDIKDYHSGTATYNKHNGTDYHFITDTNTPVFAAADGIILVKRDGIILSTGNPNSPIARGNDIWLAHGPVNDTTNVQMQSAYAHLLAGSLTTRKIGDSVCCGEYLGRTHYSGLASWNEHLHFGVWLRTGRMNQTGAERPEDYIDPYQGPENDQINASLWVDQGPYNGTPGKNCEDVGGLINRNFSIPSAVANSWTLRAESGANPMFMIFLDKLTLSATIAGDLTYAYQKISKPMSGERTVTIHIENPTGDSGTFTWIIIHLKIVLADHHLLSLLALARASSARGFDPTSLSTLSRNLLRRKREETEL